MFELKENSTKINLLDLKEINLINFFDNSSLKSVGKIQKIFFHLWDSEYYMLNIMLALLFL